MMANRASASTFICIWLRSYAVARFSSPFVLVFLSAARLLRTAALSCVSKGFSFVLLWLGSYVAAGFLSARDGVRAALDLCPSVRDQQHCRRLVGGRGTNGFISDVCGDSFLLLLGLHLR